MKLEPSKNTNYPQKPTSISKKEHPNKIKRIPWRKKEVKGDKSIEANILK